VRARQSGGHTHTHRVGYSQCAERKEREDTPRNTGSGAVLLSHPVSTWTATISVSHLSDAQDAPKRTHNDLVCAIGTCTNEGESSSVDKK
jgi:hypothetical protein